MNAVADIARRLDLTKSGKHWRGTCPACGYGGGAFLLSAGRKRGVVGWCASCQDQPAIAAIVSGGTVTGNIVADADQDAAAKVRKRERALALWRGSGPLLGTPAREYLDRRGIGHLRVSEALRFRPDTPHPGGGRYPALLALVTDAAGLPLGIHRTYLRQDGTKAGTEPAKASLGPIWGGAIRLSPFNPNMPLALGEGIETAGSAGLLMGWPAWAAISAGNLASGLALPAEARRVIIAADPDPPGRKAAQDAWTRLRAEGRDVTIATPTGSGDFNDLLLAGASRDAG